MKSTRFDYINFALFVIVLVITFSLYTIAYFATENKGDPALFGIIISIFAIFTSNSVTNIWFNHEYHKKTTQNNQFFYGELYFLEEYKSDAGTQLRGFVPFILTLFIPSLIAKEWMIAILFFIIAMLFLSGVTTKIKRFNRYLNSHLAPLNHPNSP